MRLPAIAVSLTLALYSLPTPGFPSNRKSRELSLPSWFVLCPIFDCYYVDDFLPCSSRDRYLPSIEGIRGALCPACPTCRDAAYLKILTKRHSESLTILNARNDVFFELLNVTYHTLATTGVGNITLNTIPTERKESGEERRETRQLWPSLLKLFGNQNCSQINALLLDLDTNLTTLEEIMSGNYSLLDIAALSDPFPQRPNFAPDEGKFVESFGSTHERQCNVNESTVGTYSLRDVLETLNQSLSTSQRLSALTKSDTNLVFDIRRGSEFLYFSLNATNILYLRALFDTLENIEATLTETLDVWAISKDVETIRWILRELREIENTKTTTSTLGITHQGSTGTSKTSADVTSAATTTTAAKTRFRKNKHF